MYRSTCVSKYAPLLLGSALGISAVFAPLPAVCATPPAQDVQASSDQVEKIVADAQNAIKQGNVRLAFIHLRNATRLAPANAEASILLSQLYLRQGNAGSGARALRDALNAGAPKGAILPPLFQVMLARSENAELLAQFPDPGNSSAPETADILKARALAYQNLGRPTDAIASMDRSLKLRRDGRGVLTRARIAQQQGDLAAARNFTEEAIRKSPDIADPGIFKVDLLRASNDTAGALNLATQLVARFPDNIQARFSRIETLMARNQDAEAKSDVDALLVKYPRVTRLAYYRALLIAKSGNADGAWAVALTLPSEFLDTSPDAASAVSQMAVNVHKLDVGASILGRVIAKYPHLYAIRVKLAELRLQQDTPTSALSLLQPIKESSDPAVIKLLAETYRRLDRNKDAEAVLKRLGARAGTSTNELRESALRQFQAGNIDEAIKQLTPLVAREPTNPSLVAPLVSMLTRQRRFPQALAVADGLGTDPKQRPVALAYRGDILAVQGDRPAALKAFNAAVAADPRNKIALSSRASFFAASNNYSEAARDIQSLASLDPADFAPLVKLAEISARQGRDAEARSNLQKAIDRAPENATPRLVAAQYFLGNNDAQAALKVTNDLTKLQPENAQGFALRGQAQSQLGQKKEAVDSFRRYASLDTASATPQILLGNALWSAGDRSGATDAMNAAAKISPNAPEVRAAQINLMLAQGQADAAVAQAKSFQSANPGTTADLLLAETLIKAGKSDQAAGVLAKSLAAKPDRTVLSRLVRLSLAAKDNRKAESLLSGWLKRDPKDAAVRLEYADFLQHINENQRAVQQYELVLKQEPENPLAMNNLGWLLQSSDPKRALDILKRAAQLSPNTAAIADTMGWIKLHQRDPAGGLSDLRRAHALLPGDSQITLHLAVALEANAKRAEARALLQPLLAKDVNGKTRAEAQKLYDSWK
jgi:cellulose synthase operon protein C